MQAPKEIHIGRVGHLFMEGGSGKSLCNGCQPELTGHWQWLHYGITRAQSVGIDENSELCPKCQKLRNYLKPRSK